MSIKLFVHGLTASTTEIQLLELFSHHVLVLDLTIVKEGLKSLGYGFVEVQNHTAAERAIQALNGKLIDNRKIGVRIAEERRAVSKAF
jgi:RNA recognition motif-containing protein